MKIVKTCQPKMCRLNLLNYKLINMIFIQLIILSKNSLNIFSILGVIDLTSYIIITLQNKTQNIIIFIK